MANLIIKNDVRVDGSDKLLFSIFEEGKDRAGLTFGLGKARKLMDVLNNPDLMREFRDKLTAFIGEAESVETPTHTMIIRDRKYGLFADDTIKREDTRDGKAMWRAPKVGSWAAENIHPEHIRGEAIIPDEAPKEKGTPGRKPGTSATALLQAEMREIREAGERREAMMMEMLRTMQAAK